MAPKKKAARAEGEAAAVEEATVANDTPVEEKAVEPEAKKAEAKVEKAEAKAEEKAEEKTEEKAEEAVADAEDKPKPPEKPKELEQDAPDDSRKRVKAVSWNMAESTLNVLPVFGGKLMSALSDNGFQYLLAGVRANHGIKAGRYLLETKIVEQGSPQGNPQPKRTARIGLSLAGSSVIGHQEGQTVYFDNDGFFVNGKRKVRLPQFRFVKNQTVGLLVNLDSSSENANTVSVFVNGKRASQPQKLPEEWKGKALYPTLVYRNVTLDTNFGPEPEAKLPFTCRMFGGASQEDVEQSKVQQNEAEVLLPVGLPDQGAFDWADDFLAKHPEYTEISPRSMIEWATQSGLQRQGNKSSTDHPEMNFGVSHIDDFSVISCAKTFSHYHKGKYLIMELKNNLIADERAKSLAKFGGFKKRAAVIMGEPSADYKAMVQEHLLEAKRKKADADRKRSAAEAERKRLLEERKRRAEAARKARLAGEKVIEDTEVKEEEAPAPEEPAAPVTLTDEEKAIVFRKQTVPDMATNTIAKFFTKFSIPTKEEGFDAVDFLWQNESVATKHLQDLVLQKKLSSRVEDIKPGEWFKTQHKEFLALLSKLKRRQNEWKNPVQRKALLAKIAAEKKAAKGEGEEGADAAEDETPMEINAEDVDVFSVTDVMDIGSGEPLFANFAFEDWTLLSLRYELHLLVHSFKKDIDDAERPGFHESHLAFYYSKYFHKQFSVKAFGCDAFKNVVELIKEHIALSDTGILQALVADDSETSKFVQQVEEHRRDRQRRIDAGVESAELKFQRQPQLSPQHSNGNGHGAIGAPKPSIAVQHQGGVKRPHAPGVHVPTIAPTWKRPRPIGASYR